MSTDPIYAREQDRAVEEDQELRAPSTEYPEESERDAEGRSGAGFGSDTDFERERLRGNENELRGDQEENVAAGTMEGTDGAGRFGGTDTGIGSGTDTDAALGRETGNDALAGTTAVSGNGAHAGTRADEQDGYGTPSGYGYGSENGTGYGTTAGGATDGMQNDIVIAPDQNNEFRTRWREVQAEFIDDPKRAAEHADTLVAEITKVFVAQAEQQRNRLASSWQQNGAAGTEELRLIMRRYRGLVDHMLDQ